MSDELMGIAFERETARTGEREGWLERFARSRVEAALVALEEGELVLTTGSGTATFRGDRAGPRGEITVVDPRAWNALAYRGVLGGA